MLYKEHLGQAAGSLAEFKSARMCFHIQKAVLDWIMDLADGSPIPVNFNWDSIFITIDGRVTLPLAEWLHWDYPVA